MTGQHSRFAGIYTPLVEGLLRPLPDAGDAVAGILADLARDPTLDRVERALGRIEGIRQYLHRIHVAMGEGNGQ